MVFQASMNTFMKWCTEFIETLKTISSEPMYHWLTGSKGQNVWKKEFTAMFKLFFFWNITNNFNQSVIKWDVCACFLREISEIPGTVVERDTLMSSLGINRYRCFVLWLPLTSIGVGAGTFFLGAKDFCSNSRKLARKKLRKKKWPPKKSSPCYIGRRWAPFSLIFSTFCTYFHGFCERFSEILSRFPRILSEFSPNQNFWGCACTPFAPAPTTVLRRILAHADKYLKLYNNFRCVLRRRWKLFAQSTPKFGKVTVITYDFGIRHCSRLKIKINQFIFMKHFEKTSTCPYKINTFCCMLQSNFQIFWKSFARQRMSMKNTRSRNIVQYRLFTRGVKLDFTEHRRGYVCA